MSGSTSIVSAEIKALGGDNESQDSQQVLDAYMRLYGVGLMSSSPPQDDAPFQKFHQLARNASQELEARKKAGKGSKNRGSHSARSGTLPLELTEIRNATINDREAARSLTVDISKQARHFDKKLAFKDQRPTGRSLGAASINLVAEQARICAADYRQPLVQPDALITAQTGRVVATTAKMESSQSPTQSNDGRSYDQYFPGSSPVARPAGPPEEPEHLVASLSRSSVYEQKSLAEDDTGAVVFDIGNNAATQVEDMLTSDPSPQLDRGSVTRRRTFAFQEHASESQELPETPAVRNVNPFAGNNHFQLLPTSQLFKATQFSSAVRRGASPTSSRPSPNTFPHNDISPNPISSPLKTRGLRSSPVGRTSSPEFIRTTDSPRPGGEQTTPSNTASGKEQLVPDSPRFLIHQVRVAPAPMDVYVPMQQSQEKRSSSVVLPGTASPEISDDDDDDPIVRRRKAKSKKEASLKRLTSIHFTRSPKSEDVEVPSTNTKKRKPRTKAEEYLAQCHGESGSEVGPESEDRVENSQGRPAMIDESHVSRAQDATQSTQGDVVPAEGAITRSSSTAGQPGPRRRRGEYVPRTNSTDTNLTNGERIPETSPVDKQARHTFDTPQAIPRATTSVAPKPSSNPVIVGSTRKVHDMPDAPKSSVTEYVPQLTASGKSSGNGSGLDSPIIVSSSRGLAAQGEEQRSSPVLPELYPNKVLAVPSSPPAPAFSTRSKTREQDVTEGQALAVPSSKELPRPSTSMSTLSTLSSTPSMTMSTTTPGSQEPRAARLPQADTAEASPAVAKNKRRRLNELPRLKTASTNESLRMSTRLSRQHRLDSTDELAKSPSMTPTFEHSLRGPPRTSTSRIIRTSITDHQQVQEQSLQHTLQQPHRRPGKLFDGMAFAISFQSKKHGESQAQYTERMNVATSLETKIAQAGGRILGKNSGSAFDELFEQASIRSVTSSPVAETSSSSTPQPAVGEISLTAAARHLGFTALVADGHSRKVKYMQALALGLPCIAHRWITTCLERDEIVDWAPYLLCAGESAFLGGAYRSRNLVSYDASHARLTQVMEARPRLLGSSRILIVMKKSEQGKKAEYVFLARVLGATICRVNSLEDAKAKMKASQDQGRPFDWVYIGDKVSKADWLTDAGKDAGGNNKKRKRGSGNAAATAGPQSKKLRTLSDELVIQSLILGRLIEAGEMEE